LNEEMTIGQEDVGEVPAEPQPGEETQPMEPGELPEEPGQMPEEPPPGTVPEDAPADSPPVEAPDTSPPEESGDDEGTPPENGEE
jgi:hypothetical protein